MQPGGGKLIQICAQILAWNAQWWLVVDNVVSRDCKQLGSEILNDVGINRLQKFIQSELVGRMQRCWWWLLLLLDKGFGSDADLWLMSILCVCSISISDLSCRTGIADAINLNYKYVDSHGFFEESIIIFFSTIQSRTSATNLVWIGIYCLILRFFFWILKK